MTTGFSSCSLPTSHILVVKNNRLTAENSRCFHLKRNSTNKALFSCPAFLLQELGYSLTVSVSTNKKQTYTEEFMTTDSAKIGNVC